MTHQPLRHSTTYAVPALWLLAASTTTVGCQHLTGLEGLQFGSAPTDPTTAATTATSTGAGGAGGATCDPGCEGTCVQGHCCRSDGTFAIHSFPGGLEGIEANFAEVDGVPPMEALFVSQLSNEVMLYGLDPVGPTATLRQRLKTGRGVTFPATADLDKDGHLDLVLVRSETINLEPIDLVQIHYGLLEGRFATESTKLTQPGRPAGQLALELDGDGDTDLLFATGDCVAVRWGDPGSTFATAQCIPAVKSMNPIAVVHGGFANREAALVQDGDSLYLRSWVKDLEFASVRLALGAETVAGAGALDLDGDGDDDVAVLTRATSATPSTVLTFLRDDANALQRCDAFTAPSSVEALDKFRLGDFDGDRIPDMLAIDTADETFPTDDIRHYKSVHFLFHGRR